MIRPVIEDHSLDLRIDKLSNKKKTDFFVEYTFNIVCC